MEHFLLFGLTQPARTCPAATGPKDRTRHAVYIQENEIAGRSAMQYLPVTTVRTVAATFTLLALSACGGSNQVSLGSGDSGTLTAADPSALSTPANDYAVARTAAGYVLLASRDFPALYLSPLAAVMRAVSAAGSYSQACSGGGILTATVVDRDQSFSLTAGDTATVTFANCAQTVSTASGVVTGTVSGTMQYALIAATGWSGPTHLRTQGLS
jgi:hypothetical protein